jgi:hypothetical protein
MKRLNQLNYFFTVVPFFSIIIGYLTDDRLCMMGLLFSILTGLFQIVVGISLCMENHGKFLYSGYLLGVVIFFTLWIFTSWDWILTLPPTLALYISIALYLKRN